jgi:hypothetical protein
LDGKDAWPPQLTLAALHSLAGRLVNVKQLGTHNMNAGAWPARHNAKVVRPDAWLGRKNRAPGHYKGEQPGTTWLGA